MPAADGHPSFCIYFRLTYGGINYPAIYVALLLEDYFIFHNFVERSKKNSFMGIIIFLLIAIGGWMLIPSFFWAIVFEIIVIAAGFFIISKKNG